MDSGDEYEEETVTDAIGGYEEEIKRNSYSSSSSPSKHGSDCDEPPVLSPHHTIDIPSVRRPPVPVLVPADRVSTHDLPLAARLTVVEKELFHKSIVKLRVALNIQ